MSAVAIGPGEIEMIARWLKVDREEGSGGPAKIMEWAEVRKIDAGAVSAFGQIASRECLRLIAAGQLGPLEACAAMAIRGFQLGVEAERRRRDALELP